MHARTHACCAGAERELAARACTRVVRACMVHGTRTRNEYYMREIAVMHVRLIFAILQNCLCLVQGREPL